MFTSLDLDWSLRSSKKMSAPSRHEIDLFHQLLSDYIKADVNVSISHLP